MGQATGVRLGTVACTLAIEMPAKFYLYFAPDMRLSSDTLALCSDVWANQDRFDVVEGGLPAAQDTNAGLFE